MEIINELKKIEGVKAAFLMNARGEVRPPHYYACTGEVLKTALLVAQVLAALELGKKAPGDESPWELTLDFELGKLLAFDRAGFVASTRFGTEDLTLVVICGHDADLPHIRLAVEVAAESASRPGHRIKIDRKQSLEAAQLDQASKRLVDLIRER